MTLNMNASYIINILLQEDNGHNLCDYPVGPCSNSSGHPDHVRSGPQEMSSLEIFANSYMEIHGPLSLSVCALGIPMNILNVFVLTRQHMHTPVNAILTWLAVFDLLTMLSYLPFSLHFYCLESTWLVSPERNSLGWMTFLIFHIDFTSTTHTISNWLAVILAMFRYKHIFLPAKGQLTRIRRLVRARIAIFTVVIVSILVMIPNYMMNRLLPLAFTDPFTNETQVIFTLEPLNLGTPEVHPLAQINLWIHSLLAKIFPCILMVVYCGLLLKTLRSNVRMITRHSPFSPGSIDEDLRTEKNHDHIPNSIRRAKAEVTSDNHPDEASNQVTSLICRRCCKNRRPQFTQVSPVQVPKSRRPQDNARTTRMLITIIILYVVTELPQAILIILSASVSNFFTDVYVLLGDLMDVLPLVNNGVNFLLYCAMSRDFRQTLVSFIRRPDCFTCPNDSVRHIVKQRCKNSTPKSAAGRPDCSQVKLLINVPNFSHSGNAVTNMV